MTRIGVVGSRSISDKQKIEHYLNRLKENLGDFVLVSGGCKGPDKIAEDWANRNQITTKIYKPDWKRYGRAAGPIRNEDIVLDSHFILVFWDGKSKGTQSTINLCKKYLVRYKIIRSKEND